MLWTGIKRTKREWKTIMRLFIWKKQGNSKSTTPIMTGIWRIGLFSYSLLMKQDLLPIERGRNTIIYHLLNKNSTLNSWNWKNSVNSNSRTIISRIAILISSLSLININNRVISSSLSLILINNRISLSNRLFNLRNWNSKRMIN